MIPTNPIHKHKSDRQCFFGINCVIYTLKSIYFRWNICVPYTQAQRLYFSIYAIPPFMGECEFMKTGGFYFICDAFVSISACDENELVQWIYSAIQYTYVNESRGNDTNKRQVVWLGFMKPFHFVSIDRRSNSLENFDYNIYVHAFCS